MPASRSYDRAPADIRPVTIDPGFVESADGSALISVGQDEGALHRDRSPNGVPRWLQGAAAAGSPPSTRCCPPRPATASSATSTRGKQDGRTVEIQRLIGRALRAVVDFEALGERTRGTRLRRAAGGRRHALRRDHRRLRRAAARLEAARPRALERAARPLGRRGLASAWSTAEPLLDLDYTEDSRAEVDMNVVMTGDGGPGRGAGDGRAHAALARRSSTSCSASPRAASPACATCRREAIAGRARPGCRAILASRNAHKVAELRDALPGWRLEPLRPADRRPRTGETFVANALIKARAAARRRPAWALADDSGIEVEALGGAPGDPLRALRRRGRDRRGELGSCWASSTRGRRARARATSACSLCVDRPTAPSAAFERPLRGRLGASARGSGGFGYDPVFVPDATGRRRADDGGAEPGGEERDQPPRPCREPPRRLPERLGD